MTKLTGKLIGHSLSKCVTDIYNGVVNINQVHVIDSGTCVSTIDDVKDLIDKYLNGYFLSDGPWQGFDEEKIIAIVNELLFTNRWVQERVFDEFKLGFKPDYKEKNTQIHRDGAPHWSSIKE